MYYKGILVQKKVEELLKDFNTPRLSRAQIGDIKFHVSMYVTCILCEKLEPNSEKIGEIDTSKMTDALINNAIGNVQILYDAMGGNNSVAKGNEFVKEVLEQVDEDIKEITKVQHAI